MLLHPDGYRQQSSLQHHCDVLPFDARETQNNNIRVRHLPHVQRRQSQQRIPAGINIGKVRQLLETALQHVQIGGGVRNSEDVSQRLESGASRVVVGTISVTDTQRFARWLDRFGPDQIVSALDVSFDESGTPWPRTHGWTEAGQRSLWDLLDELSGHGLKHLLCTDISKDGALSGPNFDLYRTLSERYPELEVQASGGVSGLRDLEQLKLTGARSVITGKALLEGCFTVPEALKVLSS